MIFCVFMGVDEKLYEKRMHLMFPLDADITSAESR